jgi:hypothetical protein
MQLSMQCTWISLNLSRVCNQARRWVEGKFSSSKYASISQMCKREPPRAGHLLFIEWGRATSHYTPIEGDRCGHAKVTDTAVSCPSHLCAPCVPVRSKLMVEFAFDRRIHHARDLASIALTDVVQRALQRARLNRRVWRANTRPTQRLSRIAHLRSLLRPADATVDGRWRRASVTRPPPCLSCHHSRPSPG